MKTRTTSNNPIDDVKDDNLLLIYAIRHGRRLNTHKNDQIIILVVVGALFLASIAVVLMDTVFMPIGYLITPSMAILIIKVGQDFRDTLKWQKDHTAFLIKYNRQDNPSYS